MADATVKQIYDVTAITTLADTDILYVTQSPYGSGDEGGIDWSAFKENIRDLVAAFATAGSDISITHNDAGNTLTFDYTGTPYTDEDAQDAVGAMAANSSRVTLTYVDGTPSLTADLVLGSIDETYLDTSTNASLDLADSSVQPGDNVSDLTNDAGYVSDLTSFDSDDLSEGVTNLYFTDERAQDAIGAMAANSARITLTYVDGTPSLTADLVAASIDDTYLSVAVNASLDLADSSVQPGDNVSSLTNDASYISDFTGFDTDDLSEGATNLYFTDQRALDALSDEAAANGLIARTSAGNFAARTLTGPAAGLTVSNGDGVSGNPTIALANDLAAFEALSSTGFPVRTATDTWAQRSIVAGAMMTVTNGDGVSGNPSVAVTNGNLVAEGGLSGAADKISFYTGASAKALADFTSAGRDMVGAANASAQLALLGAAGASTVNTQLKLKVTTSTLSDNTAVFIQLNGGTNFSAGAVMVIAGASGCLARVKTTATANVTLIASGGLTYNVVSGDGTLSGTTGPSASINLRGYSTNGGIYLENRIGTPISYTVFQFV